MIQHHTNLSRKTDMGGNRYRMIKRLGVACERRWLVSYSYVRRGGANAFNGIHDKVHLGNGDASPSTCISP